MSEQAVLLYLLRDGLIESEHCQPETLREAIEREPDSGVHRLDIITRDELRDTEEGRAVLHRGHLQHFSERMGPLPRRRDAHGGHS